MIKNCLTCAHNYNDQLGISRCLKSGYSVEITRQGSPKYFKVFCDIDFSGWEEKLIKPTFLQKLLTFLNKK